MLTLTRGRTDGDSHVDTGNSSVRARNKLPSARSNCSAKPRRASIMFPSTRSTSTSRRGGCDRGHRCRQRGYSSSKRRGLALFPYQRRQRYRGLRARDVPRAGACDRGPVARVPHLLGSCAAGAGHANRCRAAARLSTQLRATASMRVEPSVTAQAHGAPRVFPTSCA